MVLLGALSNDELLSGSETGGGGVILPSDP